MERSTLFYAVALTLSLVDAGAGFNAILAWLYLALRILRSLVQAIFNSALVRFALFGGRVFGSVAYDPARIVVRILGHPHGGGYL